MTNEIDIRLTGGWPALTEALKLKDCPLKSWLVERFPSTNTKAVFQAYKNSVGPIRVPASAEPAGGGSGAIGGSFDYLVRFLVDPHPDIELPAAGARRFGGRMPTAVAELAARVGAQPPPLGESTSDTAATRFDGPCVPEPRDTELLARSCWALSLLTELYRGVPPERSPLAVAVNPHTVDAEALLALASAAALDQLAALREQAETILLPALASKRGPWAVGPVFSGSALMNADADLIAAGTLVEIKTLLGSKRQDGTRYATLDAQVLFQMLGYVLLDFDDEFGIHELKLFNARYGHLATWPIQELLDILAGRPIELASLRAEFKQFLRTGGQQAIRARA
ncbi:hypothetical protein [Sciscionella marina]|uniref:hypothetical protein n=1 Tax=Sciscionella marina TaxID=508770 RepID=UPI0012F66D2F|nr:hypothetical protein [Sciscionella marina]